MQRNQISPILRLALVFSLILCAVIVIGSIVWIFHKTHYGLGPEAAEVAAAFVSMLILGLVLVGVRAGLSLDRLIRSRKFEACRIYHSSTRLRQFLLLLGYEEIQPESCTPLRDGPQGVEELFLLIDKPRRRGRLPTHSLERWIRVVLAWENRDTVRNPMTLNEFLSLEFGTYADGSPCMSENSFYENRKKVFEALRKEGATKELTTS